MEWEKAGRTVYGDGGSDTIYIPNAGGIDIHVQSRKRPIPHAGRDGVWMYTSYFVVKDGEDYCERHSLREAKECAERTIEIIKDFER